MIIYEETFVSGKPVRINRIESLIVEAVHRYSSRTGYDPDSVYLGREQYRALNDYLLDQGYYYTREQNSVRDKFHGMSVYRVDDQDHLAVSGPLK